MENYNFLSVIIAGLLQYGTLATWETLFTVGFGVKIEDTGNLLKYTQNYTFLSTNYYVGIEVLTVVPVNLTVFWDVMWCSMLGRYWCFRATCSLHHQVKWFIYSDDRITSSQVLLHIYHTTHHIPEDSNLYKLSCFLPSQASGHKNVSVLESV